MGRPAGSLDQPCAQGHEPNWRVTTSHRGDGYVVRQRICRTCEQAYTRRRYRERAEKLREFKDRPCADCGGEFPAPCMHFHHTEGDKEFNVGSFGGRSWKSVLAEIEKCVVICANCHAIRHHASEGVMPHPAI